MLDRVKDFFRSPVPTKRKHVVRRFDAAKHYDTLSNWVAHGIKLFDQELEFDLSTLRDRSRDASINDVYSRRYYNALKNGVLGAQGIRMRMQVSDNNGTLDTFANDRIGEAFNRWARMASVDGMNWKECQSLALKTAARDGECFILKRKGRSYGPFGFQIRFVEAEQLDHTQNHIASNGNAIRLGIEYDNEGRRVAYHFWERHPDERLSGRNNRIIRVLAQDVIHLYDRERASQGRGFPWLSAGMLHLAHLREYQKTELVASRVASAKMGFFTQPEGDEDAISGEEDPDEENTLIQEVDPGTFDVLPKGYGLETFDPQNPNSNFSSFVKTIIRGVSSSVGVAYHTLSNDLESTSYSSLRQGAIDERDNFKNQQSWMIDNFCTPIFEEWLSMALLSGVIGLPVSKYDKFNSPEWLPRTWQWIDPAKETSALKMQLDYNLRSKTDVMRGLGREFDATVNEIAAEQDELERLGIEDKDERQENVEE